MDIQEILIKLNQLELDETVPRNVRKIIRTERELFRVEDTEVNVKVNRLLDVLDELSMDPSVSSDIRSEIWGLVSILESMWRFIEKLINSVG